MAADYGYSKNQVGNDVVITIRSRQSALQKTMRGAMYVLFPIAILFAMLLDSAVSEWSAPLHGRNLNGNQHMFVILTIVVGGLIAATVFVVTGPSSTQLRLSPSQLCTKTANFDKGDIMNLGVLSPGSPVVTGQNALDFNIQVARVSALLSAEFSVVFDYGMTRIQVVKHLVEPQAYAVAREINAWLAA